MNQTEVFRQHLSVSIEQLNYAAELITRIREKGLFIPVDRIVTSSSPGMFDTKLTTSLHEYLQTSSNALSVFHDSDLRYRVAGLLTSIMNDWCLSQSEAGNQLICLLEETKSYVEHSLMAGGDCSVLAAYPSGFNNILLYFTHDVFLAWLVPTQKRHYFEPNIEVVSDQPAVEYIHMDEIFGPADDFIEGSPILDLWSSPALYPIDTIAEEGPQLPLDFAPLHELLNKIRNYNKVEFATDLDEKTQLVTPIQSALFTDLMASLDQITDNKFVKNNISLLPNPAQPCAGETPPAGIDPTYSNDWVSSASIHSFTVDQFLNRLELSDIEILSSLPWKVVQVCPDCFSRSVVERKTETEAGKYYCSACRKRVQVASVPYYEESHTANPHVAVTRHRHFLKTRLDEKIIDLKWLQQIKVSPGCRKTYFISIDRIEEKTYDQLAAKYEEFYAERSILLPGTKLQIQLCSDGGSVMQAKRLIALINANKNVTHVQGTVLNSAAFDLFFEIQCSKEIAPHASGMYHLSRTVHYVLENGLVPDRKSSSYGTSSLILCHTIGMNTLEIDRIKAGEDVYFDYNRLTEFLERSRRSPDHVRVPTDDTYSKDISAIQAQYAD